MNNEEMFKIGQDSIGKLSDMDCRMIVHTMIGYLRSTADLEMTRDYFFNMVKKATAAKDDGLIWGGSLLGWTTPAEVKALDESIKTDW